MATRRVDTSAGAGVSSASHAGEAQRRAGEAQRQPGRRHAAPQLDFGELGVSVARRLREKGNKRVTISEI